MKVKFVLAAALSLIVVIVGAGGSMAHVPKIKTKEVPSGDHAVVSDYLSAETVYGAIINSKVHGECGAGLKWECRSSTIEPLPYNGVNGVSRSGYHSRDFKVRFKESLIYDSVSRWRTCFIRMYHREWGEKYGCVDGDYAFFFSANLTYWWLPA